MRLRIGDLQIEIRKRDEESDEIKSILKDPDVDELLKEEKEVQEIRDFIGSRDGWISEEEILREFPDFDSEILLKVPKFDHNMMRKREIKHRHKMKDGKEFFRSSEDWTPLLIFSLLIGMTILNLLLLISKAL